VSRAWRENLAMRRRGPFSRRSDSASRRCPSRLVVLRVAFACELVLGALLHWSSGPPSRRLAR
jgi:hypothetical protein